MAVARIRKLGGTVLYDLDGRDNGNDSIDAGGAAECLIRRLGRRVVSVRYPTIERDGVGFYHLQNESCHSAGREVLDLVVRLRSLERLSLHDDTITDSSLEGITALTNLQELSISGARIGDSGVEFISRLPRLESLCLQGGTLTGDALRRGEATDQLVGAPVESRISDSGISQLAALSQLVRLSCGGRGITDYGLIHLSKLSKLRELSLEGTSVTDQGVALLRKELPQCRISY